MFKSLANLIAKKAEPPRQPARPVSPFAPASEHPEAGGEHGPIYQSLAMTAEMREALFPTTPQMISAIFERPVAAEEAPAPSSPEEMQKQLQQLQQQIQQIQKETGERASGGPII